MSYRLQRLGSELQKCISEIINYKLKNPQFDGMISVLSVDVTKDLSHAKVYVSIFGDKQAETLEALNKSAGFIRKETAATLKDIRTVPQLEFILDTSMEYSERINKLLDEIKNN